MEFNFRKTISSKVDKINDYFNFKNNDIPTLFLRNSNILMRFNVLVF